MMRDKIGNQNECLITYEPNAMHLGKKKRQHVSILDYASYDL